MVKHKLMKYLVLCMMIAGPGLLEGQEYYSQSNEENESKWHIGGTVLANFGRSINMFEISPSVGYFVFKRRVLLGVSAYYTYYSYNNYMDNYEYTSRSHYLGTGVFSRYYFRSDKHTFINYFYLHGEFELLTIVDNYKDSNDYKSDNNTNYTNVLAGIGYEQKLGKRLSLSFTLLVSLMPKDKSTYTNPIFRMGFEF